MSLVEGEPTRIASITSTSDTWQMLVWGRTYAVHVSPFDMDRNQFIVAIDTGADGTLGEAPRRQWTVMQGRLTGGVVTEEFVADAFQSYGTMLRPLAVLIASALGRPYSSIPTDYVADEDLPGGR